MAVLPFGYKLMLLCKRYIRFSSLIKSAVLIRSLKIETIYGKVGLIRTSGRFGHTFANSVNPDETAPYDRSHLDFHCLLS